MSEIINLNDFLNANDPTVQKPKRAATSSLINLSKKDMLGTLVVKPLLDVNGVPFRNINGLWEGSINTVTDDGSMRWYRLQFMTPSNYNNLSDGDRDLLNDCLKHVEMISNYSSELGYASFRKQVTLFYGVGLSLKTTDGSQKFPEPAFAIFRHNSANLLKSYFKVRNAKNTARGELTWINNFYSDNNTHLLTISTRRGDIGYDVSVSFEIDDMNRRTIPFNEITQRKSLSEEFISTAFDANYHMTALSKMKTWLNNIDSTAKTEVAPDAAQLNSAPADQIIAPATDAGSVKLTTELPPVNP